MFHGLLIHCCLFLNAGACTLPQKTTSFLINIMGDGDSNWISPWIRLLEPSPQREVWDVRSISLKINKVKKMKFREIENYDLRILTERKDGTMDIYAKFTEVEKATTNGRIYPYRIMKREIDRVQSKIESGQFLGQQDHGDSAATNLKNVSHLVKKLELVGNDGFATIRLLNTESGKNAQQILKGGGRIGLSTKSAGTVSRTGRVNDDLKLLSLDLVVDPAVKDATFSKENILENILEGIEFDEGNLDDELNEDLEKEIQALEKESYLSACESGYKGSQDEWEAQYSGSLREMMGLPKAGEKTVVEDQKLTEDQVKNRTWSYYQEAVRGGFREDFNAWKKQFPNLVELAGESIKITEKKKEPERKPQEGGDARFYYNEAVKAGYKGTIGEFKEKHPQSVAPDYEAKLAEEIKRKEPKTLEQEAEGIFKKLKEETPNSSLTLESVLQMLEKEEEKKIDIRIKRKAIATVARDSHPSASQAQLEKMVAMEVEALKKERKEMREKNWQCYKKLLSD